MKRALLGVLVLSMLVSSTPPAGGQSVFRAFSATSEWNKPLPTNAPIHPKSAKIIAEIKGYVAGDGDYPRIATGAWAEPIFWAEATDPVHTIDPTSSGPTLVNVHIPQNAAAADTADAQLTIYDLIKGVVFKMHHAVYNAMTNTWTAEGASEYSVMSNGLHCDLVESDATCPMNEGHRGYPPAIHAVRYDEVAAGVINHVLKISLGRTAECHVYPGAGHESGRGGVLTCEGLILRIKPSVNLATRGLSPGALIIARAMQTYGVVVGDTGGNAMTVKVENLAAEGRPETWSTFGVNNNSFNGKLTFSDFQVIAAGYHRP